MNPNNKKLINKINLAIGKTGRRKWMDNARQVAHQEQIIDSVVILKNTRKVLEKASLSDEDIRLGHITAIAEILKLEAIRKKIDVPFEREDYLRGLRKRIEQLTIFHKDTKQLAKLKFNACQEILWTKISEQYMKCGFFLYVLVKSRQWGASTITDAIIFDDCKRNPETNALIISHLDSTSFHLLDIMKRFAREDDIEPPKRSNDNFLIFKNILSKVWIGTARNVRTGQGTTVQDFHGSEAAIWPKGHVLWGNLEPATAAARLRAFESTPEGTGNLLHTLWKTATDPDSFTDMIGIFIGYEDDPTCREAFDSEENKWRFIDRMNNEERELFAQDLDYEQLYWRKKKIELMEADPKLIGGARENFMKAYPRNIEEAFTTHLSTAFGDKAREHISRLIATKKNHVFKGEINYSPQSNMEYYKDWHGRYELVENISSGHFVVWNEPNPEFQYILGIDTAMGVGTTSKNPDFHAVWVYERDTQRHVATWRGRIGRPDFAKICLAIGSYYHMKKQPAMLGIEITGGWGLFVLDHAIDALYPNIYRRSVYDHVAGKDTKMLGWLTSQSTTRPLMVGNLETALSEGWLKSNDSEYLSELSSFENKNGRLQAAEGCHDDILMASAIALSISKDEPAIDKPSTEDNIDVMKEYMKESLRKKPRRAGETYTRYALKKGPDGKDVLVKQNYTISG